MSGHVTDFYTPNHTQHVIRQFSTARTQQIMMQASTSPALGRVSVCQREQPLLVGSEVVFRGRRHQPSDGEVRRADSGASTAAHLRAHRHSERGEQQHSQSLTPKVSLPTSHSQSLTPSRGIAILQTLGSVCDSLKRSRGAAFRVLVLRRCRKWLHLLSPLSAFERSKC